MHPNRFLCPFNVSLPVAGPLPMPLPFLHIYWNPAFDPSPNFHKHTPELTSSKPPKPQRLCWNRQRAPMCHSVLSSLLHLWGWRLRRVCTPLPLPSCRAQPFAQPMGVGPLTWLGGKHRT